METVAIVHWHKLAWLWDVHIKQVRKQSKVNRRPALDAAGDYRTKATLGITAWFFCPVLKGEGVRDLDVKQKNRRPIWVKTQIPHWVNCKEILWEPSGFHLNKKDNLQRSMGTRRVPGESALRCSSPQMKPIFGGPTDPFESSRYGVKTETERKLIKPWFLS